MKNNKLFKFFLIFALWGVLVFITSCGEDYSGDIADLQEQVASLNAKVDAINSAVQAGAVIVNVTSTTSGIEITLSNNQKYTISNGAAGKNGSVVTIGQNGNWYIDGQDSGMPSRGEIGGPGETGSDGAWFYPNADGFWYKVEDGTETKTDNSWLPEGTITAVLENGNVTLYNVEGAEGPITLGQATLSYLTIIPDFVLGEGGIPVVNFSSLLTECGEFAPANNLRLQVSPANASIELIDVENIYFKYNNPTVVTRSADINPEASFVSLENGVLTVEVFVNSYAVEQEGSGKLDQIMLVVPLKSGGEINSNWATVTSAAVDANDLAFVRSPRAEGSSWAAMELSKTLADTKSLSLTDPRVVEMTFSQSVDITDVVDVMIAQGDWSAFNIDVYDFEIALDLNDESGNLIVNDEGGINQQQYIAVEGSTISSVVYDVEGYIPEVRDRMPVVHVVLTPKDTSLECDILEGFVKFSLVEDEVIPIPEVDLLLEEVVTAGCDELVFTFDSEKMNDAFYVVVPKELFHLNYTWSLDSEGTGVITEVTDPEDSNARNLVWTVSAEDLWNNLGATIEKTGHYTYGPSVIPVTFRVEVVQPTADLSSILASGTWFGNNNYIMREIGDADFNLNEAFAVTGDKLLDLGAANAAYAGYKYEYLFDADQPSETIGDITISVSSDGKTLLANTETVATIKAQTAGTGDILSFNKEGALATSLLEQGGLIARVEFVVTNECDRPVLIETFDGEDSFLIHFEEEEGDPVNLIVNGSFEEDFVPMRKPGQVIYLYSNVYAQPARVASFFDAETQPHWPKIDDATSPVFDTENGIWYLGNRDGYNYMRLYIDDQKVTPYGSRVLTFHNVGTTSAGRGQGAETPFHYTAVQRVSLRNNRSYEFTFSYSRVEELPGPGGRIEPNSITRFIAGIVASNDTSDPLDASFSVDVPVPGVGDSEWKDFQVVFDIPAIIAEKPELDFSSAAIIFGIQTKGDTETIMLPGQISIDNVSLLRKDN